MALAMQTLITTAGLAAAVDAEAGGLALRLTHVRLGDGATVPSQATTALDNEVLGPIEIASAVEIDATTIEVVATIEAAAGFRLREIGWFEENGTLVAISHRVDGIVDIEPGVAYPLSMRLSLVGLPLGSVTIVPAALVLDLAFLSPIAALVRSVAWLTGQATDLDIRLRRLEGQPTGGVLTSYTPEADA